MERILVASGNKGKLREIREILAGEQFEVVSMKEAGVCPEIQEDGTTFAENSVIKAETVMKAAKEIAIADDSGLVIDALNGEPGVYSARYLGEDTSYVYKNNVILDRMKDVPWEKRTARFVCAMTAALPDGRIYTVEGTMEGYIGYEIDGANGFGYDPIFFLPEFQATSAAISPEQKNAISHRGKALREMKALLVKEGILPE